MSVFTKEDLSRLQSESLERKYQITLTRVGEYSTTLCDRTGCVFCAFGAHNGDVRFQRLKATHPRQYEYCIEGGQYADDGKWTPNKDGLGMGHIFDELNTLYGDGFIQYK